MFFHYKVKINEDGNTKYAAPISAGGFLITAPFWRITAPFSLPVLSF
jgi:hypothetical protein